MATPLNEYLDQVYTEENPLPGVAGSAAGEEASGEQRHAEDYPAASVTAPESPFEKPNSCVYHSEKKRMNVQHFLQATSVIIGRKRHRI
jgi:hypothetical protein